MKSKASKSKAKDPGAMIAVIHDAVFLPKDAPKKKAVAPAKVAK